VLLLEDLGAEETACQIAARLIEQIRTAVDLAGQPVYVTASVGIALTDDPWLHPEELIRRADLAMYEAKRLGRDRYAVFDAFLEALAWQRFEIECGLRQAIERSELRVDYQPVIDLRSGTLREVEALVRWPHPERGVLYPDEFLPVAEETGLILMVDQVVLEQACRQLRHWQRQYPHCQHLTVSVNLSARHLLEPSLPSTLAAVLQRSELAPEHLRIEISERTVARELHRALDQIRALRSLGVRLALDDFGHGYAAIAALRSLPIDTLKLDRSLVTTLGRSEEDTTLIQGVIGLAKALGLTVTAEGVESLEQARQLRAFGCDFGQGTCFGPSDARRGVRAPPRRRCLRASSASGEHPPLEPTGPMTVEEEACEPARAPAQREPQRSPPRSRPPNRPSGTRPLAVAPTCDASLHGFVQSVMPGAPLTCQAAGTNAGASRSSRFQAAPFRHWRLDADSPRTSGRRDQDGATVAVTGSDSPFSRRKHSS
jgi:EAL domain-containing protein (putative c-di-GMP-specific phosphodiesterase class I)